MTNKKLDLLLQKASSYEKLALFGSRKNFLTAVAQATTQLNSAVKGDIEGVANNLAYSNNPTARQLANKLFDHLKNPQVDLNQLAGDLRQASNTFPGNDTVKVQNALNAAQAVQQLIQQPAPEAPAVTQMPAAHITGRVPFPVASQNALSSVLVGLDQGIPLMPSGHLDKETKVAINKFKQLVPSAAHLQGTALNAKIQDVFMYVHLKSKDGQSPEEILKGLQAGGTGAQARQEQDQKSEQSQGRGPGAVRPFPTQ